MKKGVDSFFLLRREIFISDFYFAYMYLTLERPQLRGRRHQLGGWSIIWLSRFTSYQCTNVCFFLCFSL